MAQINTEITKLFGIKHPILLAGMNVAAGPKLAAAVTNAGGLGVIGGIGYSPEMLKEIISELKDNLKNKNAPFGVDLLLPKVGEGARKTNYDYTKGQLDQLIDVIIESGAKLFVSAVGLPTKQTIDKLHKANILVMNMCGAPKHALKAIDLGVDIVCMQGGEGGGHTGSTPTSILIPATVDLIKGRKSPLTGKQVPVIAAGGIYCGKSLAAALMFGAQAVWVGTRFVAAEEAGANKLHKQKVLDTTYDGTIRTVIFTGRPLRVSKSPYIVNWQENRTKEIKELTSKGILPFEHDQEELEKQNKWNEDLEEEATPYLMGEVASQIHNILPAKQIIDDMISEAVTQLRTGASYVSEGSKL